MKRITRIEVQGFRSLVNVSLDLGTLTCLIGPNGAGKSNILSFLKMLAFLRAGELRRYVALGGGASALLSRGRPARHTMSWRVEAQDDHGAVSYLGELARVHERLVFMKEQVVGRTADGQPRETQPLGVGHDESLLREASTKNRLIKLTLSAVEQINFYHFHDTGTNAPLRSHSLKVNDRYLRSDGSNLAALLYTRRHSANSGQRAAWLALTGLIQRIAPYVASLEPTLNEDNNTVRLDWLADDGERYGVDALSDGTLRALALYTALTQPQSKLLSFITIDEPELGLHPAALTLLIELIRSRANDCQVLLATQSPALLDHLRPEEVVVAEREGGATVLRRLDAEELAAWLEDYSLSELFGRGVLGGRP
ncbi:AAA family ATPase [Myxococcota bacterium]|nr:AAA family ATPase [Myxococcota bacterium]